MSNTRPPAKDTTRSRWTSRDESTLQELTERKQRIHRENRDPIVELVLSGGTVVTAPDAARFVDWLIANADALRDALEPFDSGVRQS